ncbi:MAG: FAD-dependent oxidoreductase [Gammaproteobacteria bacterium]
METRNPIAGLFAALASCLAVAGCTQPQPDADVIVVGGGIAGLSAALEAGAAGRRVLVIDANSVGGGHAVKAGGFALVGTPLQEKKGYRDSPEIAERDLLAWGEDADPEWVRRYVRASRTEVHDWLTGFGVRWGFILDTPEHSVPRFHFANGSALNVVVPLMRAAFSQPNLQFRWNTEAVSLIRSNGAVTGVRVRDLRTGASSDLMAPAVIIATGGRQSDLDFVRRNWRSDVPAPARLYAGAGYFALGSGIKLGTDAGAATVRMDHQVTFTTGLPDPRDPTGSRALLGQNPSAIWVNIKGQRFISETASTKVADNAVLSQTPATHWLVFDADGLKTLRVRDAVWLGNPEGIEPLKKLGLIRQADSLAALAGAAGLPAAALEATVARWNAAVLAGNDADFGRFAPGKPDAAARQIGKPPYYAMQLFPLTRKSMGGLAIDANTRVVDDDGQPIPGLYAAGEVTGVAGINGSYGGEGTFLGPSVYLGRLAGQADSRSGDRREPASDPMAVPAPPEIKVSTDPAYRAMAVTLPPDALPALIDAKRPGYWHFEVAHRIVGERGLDCTACHTPGWPTKPAASAAQRQVQLNACDTCH